MVTGLRCCAILGLIKAHQRGSSKCQLTLLAEYLIGPFECEEKMIEGPDKMGLSQDTCKIPSSCPCLGYLLSLPCSS